MNSKTDYIILIDALRHDYITAEDTPFLYELKRQSTHAAVIEAFSFQTRPAFFAGLEPEESNICHLYEYNPDSSPFSFLRPFDYLNRAFDRTGLDRFVRGVIRRVAKRKALRLDQPAAAAVMGVEQIPLQLLPYFALSEKQFTDDPGAFGEQKSIFDLLREQGKSWAWIGYPRHYGSTESILSAYSSHEETDVAYLHFSELDWMGHRFGPGSKEIRAKLKEFDTTIDSLISPALENGRRAVLFGDHGMVEVEYSVDIQAELNELPLIMPDDYLCFIDSTQARFWFFSSRAEAIIVEKLEKIEGGRILQAEERGRLRINFTGNNYGDLIYAVDGPGILHPSFFSKSHTGPRGMHGYLPEIKDNMTQVIVAGTGVEPQDLGTIPMVQIFDLLCEALLE